MKAASTALRALLASREFYSADTFMFVLADGTVLRYTDADRDIILGTDTYSCGGVSGALCDRFGNNGSGCTWRRGLEVDTLTFNVIPRSEAVNGVPFLAACRRGMFDGAELTLSRAYMPTFGDTSPGAVVLFVGRVAEVDAGRTQTSFQIASHLELLTRQIPQDIYTPACINGLFDIKCGLSRSAYTITATVLAGSTSSLINASLSQATGWFDLGTITFTSGPNNGTAKAVKQYTHGSPSIIKLLSPLYETPIAGDAFSIVPGCDRLLATCSGKFNNRQNFRGFPYIPDPNTSL